MNDSSFRLGSATEHVTVRVVGAVTVDAAAWVPCEITVVAGAFHGTYLANLTTDDFGPFRRALSLAHQRLDGDAHFATIEDQIAMVIEGDGKGHFVATGTATDVARIGNKLSFRIELDQTDLGPTLRQLDALCAAFESR